MQAHLLCNDDLFASKVRTILVRESVDCPTSNVFPIEDASRRLAKGTTGLVVAILPTDPVECLQALEILGALPRQDQTWVIAIGPAADPKLVIRALRGIVDDYMDIDELEPELVAALAGLKARQPERQTEARMITVLSAGGGSGSSTLASCVSTILAKEHKTVGLIDLKLDAGDLASLMNLKPTYTLADLCQNVERMDRIFFEQALVKHASGVHLLSPPRQIVDVGMVTPEGIRQALTIAREMFPYVVVDLGHRFGEEEVGILRQSDVVVVVMKLDFTSLMNARRILEHLEFLGIPADKIRLVVNRYGQPKEVPAAKAEDALGIKVFHYVPDEPKVVNRANNNGVPVVIDAPFSKVSKSITKLAFSLNGHHAAP